MTFRGDITKFTQKTKLDGATVIRRLLIQGFTGVIVRSPVREGRFRGNWRLALNKSDRRITEKAPSRSRGTETGEPIRNREIDPAIRALRNFKWGDEGRITNSLIYGPRLEDGFSPQSQAMVSRTVQELTGSLARIVGDLRLV